MYSIAQFGRMIADDVRTSAYAAALKKTITADSVVLDIGAGTGIFSLLACHYGAKKVYAIEPNISANLITSCAAENGFQDIIQVIQDISTNVTLAEKVDVIVSDLRGCLPLFNTCVVDIIDTRKRLLKPNGKLIPCSDRVMVAIASAADRYREIVEPWDSPSESIKQQSIRKLAINSPRNMTFSKDEVLPNHQCLIELDYLQVNHSDVAKTIHWDVTDDVLAHGICCWFETTLGPGCGFSSAPGQSNGIYGHLFFPWERAVTLDRGDTIDVDFSATLLNGEYIWRWNTRIGSKFEAQKLKASFCQSTLNGEIISVDSLRRQSVDYLPSLGGDGECLLYTLKQMQGVKTLQTIALELSQSFPDRFSDEAAALSYVARLSVKYGI